MSPTIWTGRVDRPVRESDNRMDAHVEHASGSLIVCLPTEEEEDEEEVVR